MLENKIIYKCDFCGKEMDVPVLTMTWKNQEDKHYCEDCIEQVCWVTAYTFWLFNKENLVKSLEINNNQRKGCEGCNESK